MISSLKPFRLSISFGVILLRLLSSLLGFPDPTNVVLLSTASVASIGSTSPALEAFWLSASIMLCSSSSRTSSSMVSWWEIPPVPDLEFALPDEGNKSSVVYCTCRENEENCQIGGPIFNMRRNLELSPKKGLASGSPTGRRENRSVLLQRYLHLICVGNTSQDYLKSFHELGSDLQPLVKLRNFHLSGTAFFLPLPWLNQHRYQ